MRDGKISSGFNKADWNAAAPFAICGSGTWLLNLWVIAGAHLSPFLLSAWFIKWRRRPFTQHPTLLGILFGLFGVLIGFVPSSFVEKTQRIFPVQGFGPGMALRFIIETLVVGAPLTLFVARRHGSQTAFLVALGFLAPTVNWAFWDISYGAPPLNLPAHRLELQLPGTFIFILGFISAMASQSSPRNQTRLAIATATLTISVLAFGGILGRGWLPPRTQLGYNPALAPRYLLVYGVAVAALLFPAFLNSPFPKRGTP